MSESRHRQEEESHDSEVHAETHQGEDWWVKTLEYVRLHHGGPPGAEVSTASTSIWYRVNGGEWRQSPERSLLKAKLLWRDLAERFVEVREESGASEQAR